MIAALQRRKLNMFKWREGMLSPRAFVRGNPARVKFAAENYSTCCNMISFVSQISRGYSETVTHFYAHMLDLAMSRSEYATFEEFLQDNEDLMSWDLLFRYYSKSVLKNPESQSR